MNVPVPISTDLDGFLRRECPHCRSQFKWHLGPIDIEAAAEPAPELYYCPLCGTPADPGRWNTPEQLEYARATAMPAILTKLASVPPALVEPTDMQVIAPPCHDYEPVKVPVEHDGPFHCLICGAEFVI